jgi:hypothetical protein
MKPSFAGNMRDREDKEDTYVTVAKLTHNKSLLNFFL